MPGWFSTFSAALPVLVAAAAVLALLRGRRWIFLAWTAIRPAAWPAAWGLLLVAALGMTDQGRALVDRAHETGRLPLLLAVCLLAGALMGYASASLLFVRYEPIAAALRTVARQIWPPKNDADRRWEGELNRRCDRLRRVFPVLVAASPLIALLPALVALWFPAHPRLPGAVPFAAIAVVLVASWFLARTPVLRAEEPPRRRWLWPLRYPDLSDPGIADACEAAAGRPGRLRRVGDAFLGGMVPGTRWAFNLAWALGAGCFAAALLAPVSWAQAVGTAAVVTMAVASYAVLGALAAYWINRRFSVSIPYALALALFLAGLFARWDVSDNHAVRTVPAEAGRAAEEERARSRPTLEEQLAAWLEARKLRPPPAPGAPYPLVVAAAQGGGIRAALWTALALGGLQKQIPAFPCDLFAVTAVSGGSLGALTYAAMLDKSPPPCSLDRQPSPPKAAAPAEGYMAAAADAFGDDLLGPAAAGLFFPDMLQRFLPFPWLPDRQTYLELGWERAWADHAGTAGRLDGPFLSLFPEAAAGRRPVFMLIATEVEGGRRWIASNARIDRDTFADAADTLAGALLKDDDPLEGKPVQALPASAAAGLSARFPYLSPPGRLHGEAGSFRLLDGGIVESSGAATAAEILLFLRSQCDRGEQAGVLACRVVDLPGGSTTNRRPRKAVEGCDGAAPGCILVRPALIQITNDAWDPGGAAQEEGWQAALVPRFPELLSPIEGLLASRTGRGRAAHDRLQGDPFLFADEHCLDLDLVLERPADPSDRVPLGWTLRERDVAGMVAKIGTLLAQGPLDPARSQVDAARWRANVYARPVGKPCGSSPGAPVTTAASAPG